MDRIPGLNVKARKAWITLQSSERSKKTMQVVFDRSQDIDPYPVGSRAKGVRFNAMQEHRILHTHISGAMQRMQGSALYEKSQILSAATRADLTST